MRNYFDRVVVVDASRGIGGAVVQHIMPRTTELITVSRSPSSGNWIEADITTKVGIETVKLAVGNSPLDALLYMGGTWETNAFTDKYSFEQCSDGDIENVIAVNLLAPILLVKSLLPALCQATNPKIILYQRNTNPCYECQRCVDKILFR